MIAAAPQLRAITDEGFRTRFEKLPGILEAWMQPYGGLAGRSILDFGCGEGVTALAFALSGAARVVGVDIMPDVEGCLPAARSQLGLDTLPSNLALHRVTPGELHDPRERFDFVYSWSAFEHADQGLLDQALEALHAATKPAGHLFIQIAPLYYSSEGSHLAHRIPTPWAHLLWQDSRLEASLRHATSSVAEFEALWSTYRTLNRLTVPDLLRRVKAAGFEVLRTHVTHDGPRPTGELLETYAAEALTTNQVALIARWR